MDIDTFVNRAENNKKIYDALIRRGEIKTKFPFFTDDIMHLDVVGYEGETYVYLGVEFRNPVFFHSRGDASQTLLGKDYYSKLEKAVAGRESEVEKALLLVDKKIGQEAKKKNYDAVITPSEIQVIDLSVLPQSETAHYDSAEGSYVLKPSGNLWGVGIGYKSLYYRKYGRNN